MQYALDDRQRDLVRTISAGLGDGSIKRTWTWMNMPSDTVGGELDQVFTSGIPEDRDWEIRREDFRDFAACGFLDLLRDNGKAGAYHLFEQVIHDAVESDFADPRSASSDATPSFIIEQGAGSSLNIAFNAQSVTQTISASTSIPNDVKADLERAVHGLYEELEKAQTAHPQESLAVDKHVRRLVEDVAEPQPDKDDVSDSLSRLERAGQAFSSIAGIVLAIARIGESIAQLPFMP